LSLIGQALVGVLFLKVMNFSLLKQGDTIEYVTIADNLIAGHGYSAERVSPWRVTASRVPGMLLTNIPLRYFFAGNDAIVTVLGKLILLAAALFTLLLAKFYFESEWAILAAAVFTLIPSVAYYGVNPYSTGPLYVLSYTIIYAGMVSVMQGKRFGGWLVFAGSMYAMSLRPAALFPLMALVGGAIGLGLFFSGREIRRYLWVIALASALGTGIIYLGWSYRNQVTFNDFSYSSVGGFNLLHFNAVGMEPFLDDVGKREVEAAVEQLPQYIHRYHEPDQMQLSERQGSEGKRLLIKYPVQFLESHLLGSLRSFVMFDVELLNRFAGGIATLAVAAFQSLLTLMALIGMIRQLRIGDDKGRALILLIGFVGSISILSAGMLGEPRFRLPLEPLIALGIVFFIKYYVVARYRRNQEPQPNPSL